MVDHSIWIFAAGKSDSASNENAVMEATWKCELSVQIPNINKTLTIMPVVILDWYCLYQRSFNFIKILESSSVLLF